MIPRRFKPIPAGIHFDQPNHEWIIRHAMPRDSESEQQAQNVVDELNEILICIDRKRERAS